MKTLHFEKSVVEIDLPTLMASAPYENAKGGFPKSRPIEHYQLIQDILDMAQKEVPHAEIKLDPIVVHETGSQRLLWRGEAEKCPVENYLLNRLVTRAQIIVNGDDEHKRNMAIAVSYNEKGISIAFGSNVWACQNQCIFGKNIMHTYSLGGNKLQFHEMIKILRYWLQNFKDLRHKEYELIQYLMTHLMSKNDVDVFFGRLIQNAVLHNAKFEFAEDVLNVSQVCRMIENFGAAKKEFITAQGDKANEEFSAWDVLNWGTATLKPQTNDMTKIYHNTSVFSNHLLDCLSIPNELNPNKPLNAPKALM